jgi:hypothetical protein
MRSLAIFALLPFVAAPALAQGTQPGPSVSSPSGANSGAGTPGLPGSKSGPAAKPSNGAGVSSGNQDGNRTQDAAKVPGLPGGKSGPAVRQPSSQAPK